MQSGSWNRFLIRTSVCVVAALATAASFGAAADRQKAQARVLDRAELLCSNCFFAPSEYYFCFATDDKVMIAYQSTPVINWEDPSKNFLTRVHHQWIPWNPPGETIPMSYDDKHIWVTRADGKEVKLIRSERHALFTHSAQCSGTKSQPPAAPKSQ
jgi:hypothetical protein